jgi:COMPASS component BRE2
MASEADTAKEEPAPAAPPSSIPQKRALDEGHSPAVPSPLNPEVAKPAEAAAPLQDDAAQVARSKPTRTKKETLKKREAKGIDSTRATPDPKSSKEPKQSESGPLRYKLAPPKPSDFDPPRGPVLTLHHQVTGSDGENVEFFETSDQ